MVVNAAGAWSAYVARMAGIKIPTRPHGEDAVVTEPLMPLPYFPGIMEVYGRQTKSGQILIGENDFPEQASGYSTEVTLDFLPRIEKDKNLDIAEALNLNRFERKYREFPGRWYK